jgi:hypothetical protein
MNRENSKATLKAPSLSHQWKFPLYLRSTGGESDQRQILCCTKSALLPFYYSKSSILLFHLILWYIAARHLARSPSCAPRRGKRYLRKWSEAGNVYLGKLLSIHCAERRKSEGGGIWMPAMMGMKIFYIIIQKGRKSVFIISILLPLKTFPFPPPPHTLSLCVSLQKFYTYQISRGAGLSTFYGFSALPI